ncbi:NfeD family protein [Paracoccaceae bacterium GXU_MW_L88]
MSPVIWALIGLALLGVEIFLLGSFWLIGMGIAALGVAMLGAVLPLGLGAQLVIFAILAVIAQFAVKKWQRDQGGPDAPKINDRARGMIGQTGTVITNDKIATEAGHWSAKRKDGLTLQAGAKMKIVGAENGVLLVEPLP